MKTLIILNDAPYGSERTYDITEDELAEGSRRSTLDELTAWTLEADKVLTF